MSEPAPKTEQETITIYQLLERSAESALEFQREDGSFPPGRNYTYDEPETPVRTTSNWLHVLLQVYRVTGDRIYRDAAHKATDYLLSENRPHGYTYYCRKTSKKDHCNGLIGQALPIRALVNAGTTLDRNDALQTAKTIYDLHPFDSDIGLWRRVEITGEDLGFDRTLNHQIIFAKAAAKLAEEYPSLDDDLILFLDGLQSNLRVYDDGLIQHYVRPQLGEVIQALFWDLSNLTLVWNELTIHYHYHSRYEARRQKEIGYQPINLQSLGMLKKKYPSHRFWKSEKLKRAIYYASSEEYQSILYDIDSGATLPGIMTALSLQSLTETKIKDLTFLIEKDLSRRLDSNTLLLTSDLAAPSDQMSSICVLSEFPRFDLTVTI